LEAGVAVLIVKYLTSGRKVTVLLLLDLSELSIEMLS